MITRKKTLTGLSPMDGITDPAFREITDTYGHPDMLFTEFVPVEAIAHGVTRVMKALKRHKTEIPVIAQFFGRDLKSYYKSAVVAAELGFDGIDINMGCPDKNIAKKGGGAGLIGEPDLAVEIIKTVKQAVSDWFSGKSMEDIRLSPETITWIRKERLSEPERKLLPVSVKTRIGLDKPITEEWISRLIEAAPEMISLHGRTLLQLYRGKADWDEIAKAALLVRNAGIVFLGNGDIHSLSQAHEYAQKYGCDGVLIGRAALGNPWIFSGHIPTKDERIEVMLEHCRLFLKYRPELKLFPMRKHLAWYMTGFEGSRALRDALMHVETVADVERLFQSLPA